MEVGGRKEKLNGTGCKTKDIASHLDDERNIPLCLEAGDEVFLNLRITERG